MDTDEQRRAAFEAWMDGMDILLEEFLADLPDEISDKLDYSIESLDVLEAWLLDKYPSNEAMRDDPDVTAWDAASRYLGQVLVKHVDGEWLMDIHTGRPIVLVNRVPRHDPMILINVATKRRTSNGLRTLAENNLEVVEGGGFEKYLRERGIWPGD